MSDTVRARHSLKEEVQKVLRQQFESAPGPRSRILWWDAGGHLRVVLRRACQEMDVPLVERDHPLAFRRWVAEQGAVPSDEPDRVVWYVPESRRGRDWFKDVENMGGIVEKSIEDLAADLYGIHPWQLRPWETDQTVSDSVAATLDDELGGRGLPTLQDLQARILTGDDSRPVEYILRSGWGDLPRSDAVTDKIRRLLTDEHVPHLASDDGPDVIIQKVRRWAVAGWLHQSGVPTDAFPDPIAGSRLKYAFRRLEAVLETDPQTRLLGTYQQSYWPEALDAVDEPWTLGRCPVDGAAEERLWSAWWEAFEAERFAACRARAHDRAEALREYTGRADREVTKSSPPWIRAWRQAAALADLGHRYETWDDRDVPAHALYADREEGSWQIDAAVRRIIVSGTPEEELPHGHPARESLADHRDRLVETEYLSYLRDLADEMESALVQGELLDDNLSSSVDFWADHREELGAGNEALFFYLDALRLDLARELADRLQARSDASGELDLNVEESTRLSVLPSETKFGMAAVLPGRPQAFEVRLESGELNAYRNGTKLDAKRRRDLLGQEGWAVAPHNPSAWSSTRVAYVDTELDDIGEKNLNQIEEKLAKRVEQLAERIFRRMKQGNWNRTYVVADHGFVLLPEQAQFEDLSPPDGDVARRRVAAEELSEDGPGVLLAPKQMPALSYLKSPVRILLDPQQRFSKQGIPDSRYYHGGALPQECILSFLKIEAA